MRRYKPYAAEILLVLFTMVVGVLGFWGIYVGPRAGPEPHHHLHVATTFGWMGLLLAQLLFLARGERALHRKVGLAIIAAAPLLVASAALLTVHSARSAIAEGQPDRLVVQNVLGTLWLALLLILAFVFKRPRKLHGALMSSTLILLLGPALFFALLTFVPAFRIEGPETFYRFESAGITGQVIILALVALLFVKDWRHNWAYLLAASIFFIAEAMRAYMAGHGQIDGFTHFVATPSRGAAFAMTALVLSAVLARLVWPTPKGRVQFQDTPN